VSDPTTTTTAETPTAAAPLHDLGVLFVHGIGEQKKGATLVACGEPLVIWLRRRFEGMARSWLSAGLHDVQQRAWFDKAAEAWRARGEPHTIADRLGALRALLGNMRSGGDAATLPPLEAIANDASPRVLVATATLHDAQIRGGNGDAPSHAELELQALMTSTDVASSRWLLAESWWADAFTQPSFRQLAAWLMTVIPFALGSHFGSRVRRAFRVARANPTITRRIGAAASTLANLLLLALSLPMAIAGELLVAAVVLFALLPIPRLRPLLLALERVLAATIGDSLILVASPLQQAAMVGQVQHDVQWLAARCARVAVVAHSQGAAVAHRALRRDRPANVNLLFTYGSGLRKLEEIEQISKTDDGLGGRLYLTFASVVLIGYAAASAFIWHSGWAPWAAASGGVLFLILIAAYLFEYAALDVSWFATRFATEGLMWADYSASSDPVPNGVLQDYDPELTLPRSYRVWNEQSFFADHTTYWQNVEEFIGPVVWWLTRMAGEPWRELVPMPDATAFQVRRRWRVGGLVFARWLGVLSAGATIYARRADWHTVVQWLWLRSGGAVRGVVGDTPSSAPPTPDATIWLATAGALLLLYAASRVTRFTWDRWSWQSLRPYFNRQPTSSAAAPRAGWIARWRETSATVDGLQSMWLFYSMAAAQIAIAVMLAPALIGRESRPGWWAASNVTTIAGLALAVVHSWLSQRSARKAATRARTFDEQAARAAASAKPA
jgi:hypothetical protein